MAKSTKTTKSAAADKPVEATEVKSPKKAAVRKTTSKSVTKPATPVQPTQPAEPIELPGTIFVGQSIKPERLTLALANRHGLATGATGTGKTVTLQTSLPGLELEKDAERTWPHLRVTLKDPTEGAGGRRRWEVQVEIPADTQVSGKFPRDAKGYQDTAVYLRTKGPEPQVIRIPVRGVANERQ